MGDFEVKERWKVYLDKPTKEKLREILDHLEDNYDGPSDFVQQKIQEEQALSIEERIKRAEQEEEEAQQKKERLKRIKQEREQQDKLRDKRELLKEKQKKLRELADKEQKSRSEVREEVVEEMREKAEGSPKIDDVDEYLEKDSIQTKISRRVDREFSSSQNKDELVECINRLQKQVAELNGGKEDYFMDLETVSNLSQVEDLKALHLRESPFPQKDYSDFPHHPHFGSQDTANSQDHCPAPYNHADHKS